MNLPIRTVNIAGINCSIDDRSLHKVSFRSLDSHEIILTVNCGADYEGHATYFAKWLVDRIAPVNFDSVSVTIKEGAPIINDISIAVYDNIIVALVDFKTKYPSLSGTSDCELIFELLEDSPSFNIHNKNKYTTVTFQLPEGFSYKAISVGRYDAQIVFFKDSVYYDMESIYSR